MKITSLLNHKGGTGKTTCTTNIGSELARRGFKVLLIDFDPQANLSQGLGIFESEETIYTSLSRGKPLKIYSLGNMDIIPSSLDLAGLETELSSKMAREHVLKNAIEKVKENYDYILIDCPPSLGIMTINCLIASDSVIVPLEAEFFAFKGIDTIISVIDQVNKAFGKNIKIDGVILNEYNPRKKLTQSIEAELRTHLKETLLDSRLRTNIAISESQINGKTVYDYDPNSNGAKDFEAIVTELIKKEKI
jgi:chromosome partitioning protein